MYDIVFLGGGPAGYEGAIAAGKKGLKVAVVESDRLGGTCLQRGCVPTKTLLHTVKVIKQVQAAAKMGIKVNDYSLDLDTIKKNKERVVAKLTRGIELLLKQSSVELVSGRGKITSPDTVVVNEEQELKAKNIVIATGSKPAELPFLKFNGSTIIHSDQALELRHIPEKLLVIGAGAIGVEMGLIYRYLGSQVTVVEILEHIVPGSDVELSEILKKELQKQKIKVYTAAKISDPVIDDGEDAVTFTFRQGEKQWQESFALALLSVGRLPNSEDVFAAPLAIEKDERGFIKVDANLQTKTPHIFACGDVIGPPLLAHKAAHQAAAIVDFIAHKKEVTQRPMPAAVFTFPELASVGITEEEARDRGLEVKIGRFPYAAGSRANAVDEKVGLVKVIADKNNALLGAHILGAEAGELLPILTYGVTMQMKADEFKELVMIHPTLSENTWEALGEIAGFSIHI